MHGQQNMKDLNMFHTRALQHYLNLRNKTNKWTCPKYVLSHTINYQNVSIAFAIITKVALQEY